MRLADADPMDIFLRRLDAIATLDDMDREALRALPAQFREVAPQEVLARRSQRATGCWLITEGFTMRSVETRSGKLQVLAFHVPGDVPDLQSLHLPVMDHDLSTLTRCRLVFLEHGTLIDLCRRRGAVAAALWRETLIDSAVFRTWLTVLGRLTAHERVAHLLCEFHERMAAVGLADGGRMAFPLTQERMGDALGLSLVHVNRVLQDFRAEGLIALRQRVLTVHKPRELRHVGGFDPAYLHLRLPLDTASAA